MSLHLCGTRNAHYVVGAAASHPGGSYRLEPDGVWRHWGADDPSLTAIATEGGTVWATGQNGVWRSRDGGANWRITTDWRVTDARAIALDPARPGHLYVGLPDGLIASADGGETWARREEGLPPGGRYTADVAVDATRPGRVVAGCERGLCVSADEGRTWWLRLPTSATVTRVLQAGPDTWFATTERDGLWRSDDGAWTWTAVDLPAHGTLYDVAADGDVIAVVDHANGVWLGGPDGGWRLADGLAGAGAHRLGLDPAGTWVLATYRDGLLLSDDRGATWRDGGMPGTEVRSFSVWGAS